METAEKNETVDTRKDVREIPIQLFKEFGVNPEKLDDGREIAQTHEGSFYGWFRLKKHREYTSLEIWGTREFALESHGSSIFEVFAGTKYEFDNMGRRTYPNCVDYRIPRSFDAKHVWFAEYVQSIISRLLELVKSGEYNIEIILKPK